MTRSSRRQFLTDTLFASAAAVAATTRTAWAVAEGETSSPSEKLGAAVIGVRSRGNEHIQSLVKRKDCEILYIVDVDSEVANRRADEVGKIQGRRPQAIADMRRAFDDPALNFVTTATPNHWHALTAIWAMQAGKDVYVEKPVSHNVSESRRCVEAAAKYGRICQAGTQSRSSVGLHQAMRYLHSGKLGTINFARGLCYKRRKSIGPVGDYPIPTQVDYNLWQGPAQEAKLTRQSLHYDWHWQWPYGNGDVGNQGPHQWDIARWGMQLDQLSDSVICYGGRFGYEDAGQTPNTQIAIHQFGDRSLVFEVRGLETEGFKGTDVGVIFEGSEGYMVVPSYTQAVVFDPDGKKIADFSGGGDHFDNFIQAIRARDPKKLNSDILTGHLSCGLPHLSNISYRLGQPIPAGQVKERLKEVSSHDQLQETFNRTIGHLTDNGVDTSQKPMVWGAALKFDPQAEKFIGNADADALLTREYRAPFVVPAAGKV